MRKFSLFIILAIVSPTLYFSSCAKVDDVDDNIRPVIMYAMMNVNDTLYKRNSDGTAEVIKLNDSTNLNHQIDTLVIGKWLYISAQFIDNYKLSTFKVETNLRYRYKGDPVENQESDTYKDSILEVVKLGRNIFGKDSITVTGNRLLQIPDTITRMYKNVPYRLGLIAGDYPLKVVCMDVAGNRDSVTFPVRYLHRSIVYEARGK